MPHTDPAVRNARRRALRAENLEETRDRDRVKMRRFFATRPPEYRPVIRARERLTELRRYGTTPTEVAEMVVSQGGRCAICQRNMELVVDHDHETGRVRGLLCRACNLALGLVHDDPGRLSAAIAYLMRASD